MNTRISESIFSTKNVLIPMADVQHIEKLCHDCDLANGTKKGDLRGIMIITCHTKWNYEHCGWENNIYLGKEDAKKFIEAYCYFRYEKDIKEPEVKP